MKIRKFIVLNIVIILVMTIIGVYHKKSYEDFNKDSAALENFAVGLISDDLLEMQLGFWDEILDEHNYIVAATCEETFTYRFSCTTQKIKIKHIFKGEGLKEGDNIEIARSATEIYFDEEDMKVMGLPSINMGFVNEMIPKKTYLIFLDRKMNTHDEQKIYIQTDASIIAPIFCYDKIENKPTESITPKDFGSYAEYKKVKDNEFFLMSDKSIEKMENYKQKLFQKYPYES